MFMFVHVAYEWGDNLWQINFSILNSLILLRVYWDPDKTYWNKHVVSKFLSNDIWIFSLIVYNVSIISLMTGVPFDIGKYQWYCLAPIQPFMGNIIIVILFIVEKIVHICFSIRTMLTGFEYQTFMKGRWISKFYFF